MNQPSPNPQARLSLNKLVSEASDLMLKGDFEKAIVAWEEILALGTPKMPNGVWARLASAHRKLNNHNRVLDVAARAKDACLLYTSPSPRDRQKSRMPSSA